jgi:hypothetical protein
MAGIGAEQKQLTLPAGFRALAENGHSRYGHLMHALLLSGHSSPMEKPLLCRTRSITLPGSG